MSQTQPLTVSMSFRTSRAKGPSRALDIFVSGSIILFLLPLLIFVAIAVKLGDGGPVLFRHTRIGLNGRAFGCLKFRSMVTDADRRLAELLRSDPAAQAEWSRDHKLRHDTRITPIGFWLRKLSIDELPQFFNVLMGDMSLVGPRPIVAEEASRYGRWFASYCSVRPGITGLWQVSGRNDVSYRRRVAMDVLYVRRKNLWMDLRLLVLTVPAILLEKGAY